MQEPMQALCRTHVVAVLRSVLIGFLGACTVLTQKEIFFSFDKIKQEPENPPQKRGNGLHLVRKHRQAAGSCDFGAARTRQAERGHGLRRVRKTGPAAGSCDFRGATARGKNVGMARDLRNGTGACGFLWRQASVCAATHGLFSRETCTQQRSSARATDAALQEHLSNTT